MDISSLYYLQISPNFFGGGGVLNRQIYLLYNSEFHGNVVHEILHCFQSFCSHRIVHMFIGGGGRVRCPNNIGSVKLAPLVSLLPNQFMLFGNEAPVSFLDSHIRVRMSYSLIISLSTRQCSTVEPSHHISMSDKSYQNPIYVFHLADKYKQAILVQNSYYFLPLLELSY